MLTVNIHDAKTQLSRLVEKAAKGEAFIIAKAGKPMVKVIPLGRKGTGTINRLGFMAGEFSVPDDFDQMSGGGIADMFEGKAA
ncbi:MAG: type II toxin-antitoxin system prevent-host-death family antitoxin [Betaproteobacteria bacterium]|nr:type II toxin-antitoxin system prevent-host-death family antitoxin [Betaproteobacteria bacterium]